MELTEHEAREFDRLVDTLRAAGDRHRTPAPRSRRTPKRGAAFALLLLLAVGVCAQLPILCAVGWAAVLMLMICGGIRGPRGYSQDTTVHAVAVGHRSESGER